VQWQLTSLRPYWKGMHQNVSRTSSSPNLRFCEGPSFRDHETRDDRSSPHLTTAQAETSRKRDRTYVPSNDKCSESSESYNASKIPSIEDIEGSNWHPRHEMDSYGLKIFSSQVLKQIMAHRFPRKFVMSSFNLYSGAPNPIQHLWHHQDKLAIYSHDDLMSRVFPSCLKGVTFDWFYSLLSHSLWDFEEMR